MENSNQASPQVPSGVPTPPAMSPHVQAKHKGIPVLIMVGILLSLVLSALMMESVRNGEFSLSSKSANLASVSSGLLAVDSATQAAIDRARAKAAGEAGAQNAAIEESRQQQDAAAASRDAQAAGSAATAVGTVAPALTSPSSAALLPAPSLDTPAARQTTNARANTTSGADCTGNSCQFDNPLGQTGSLETFLNKLLDVIILIGSIAVVLSIIMAGLKYVTAQGDEGQIESAHKQLTWTVIGAAILLGAKVIAMVVQNTVKALA